MILIFWFFITTIIIKIIFMLNHDDNDFHVFEVSFLEIFHHKFYGGLVGSREIGILAHFGCLLLNG